MNRPNNSLQARLGLVRFGPDPAILFAGDNQAEFEQAAPVIERLRTEAPRLAIVLASDNAELQAWLAERFNESHVVPMPLNLPGITELWLSRGKIRTVVALNDASLLTARFDTVRHRRATPLARIGAATVGNTLQPELTVAADELGDGNALCQKLLLMVGRERPWETRTDQKIIRAVGEIMFNTMERPAGPGWLSLFVNRLNTPDSLRAELNHPRTILCLGNGPSSENPDVSALSYDALFRVNHSWLARPHLTNPDVVFTGERSTMRRIKTSIFGVRGTSAEKNLLMTRALNFFRGKLVYFVADQFGDLAAGDEWEGMRPTNGAIMIAVAAGLAPDRLAIAGIDMFRHPAGSYPGGSDIPNAYTPAHSHDADLAVILTALDDYHGELVILSEVLKAEWDAHRKEFSQT